MPWGGGRFSATMLRHAPPQLQPACGGFSLPPQRNGAIFLFLCPIVTMEPPKASPVHCIVPARMASSRFPGKPLVELCGRPMVLRTLDRALLAGCFSRIVCATDSPEIARVVEAAGFEALLTPEFATGSDRVAYAASKLHLELVVNLQGDEPVAGLSVLRSVAKALAQEPKSWVTACAPLAPSDGERVSVVKVHVQDGYATDFQRDPVPANKGWFAHRGIYAYSLESMQEFGALPQTRIEIERSLEQMRILGSRPIRVVPDPDPSASVDLPSDVALVERIIKEMHL